MLRHHRLYRDLVTQHGLATGRGDWAEAIRLYDAILILEGK